MNNNQVKIVFTHDAFENEGSESAWAYKAGDYFKLDNILFYVKEYSWGDLVEAKEKNGELWVTKLIKESGHSTIRILFYDAKLVSPTRTELKKMGCDSELSNIDTLISVDIPSNVSYVDMRIYLDDGENKELWGFEEACISDVHRKEVETFFTEDDEEE